MTTRTGLDHGVAKAVEVVNKLRSAGVGFDLDLPTIVFAGKQSAGKSSVVEAVTGVQLPRNAGTCTRCPIEVRTTKDVTWGCEIRLREVFNDSTQCMLLSSRESQFCSLSSGQQEFLAEKVGEAQNKLLTLSGSRHKFTRNIVVVELQGPDCGDLALVDLPGLIQSTEAVEDEKYIECVQDLVRDYIKKPNTIIVQCIQADEDVENQAIRKYGRDADERGERTIGVLTKPDRVEVPDEILKVLSGEKYKLDKGYYAVRTPNQMELKKLTDPKTTWKEARQIEEEYFSKKGSFFREAAPGRCGSTALMNALCGMLKSMVDSQMPSLKIEVNKKLMETTNELQKFKSAVTEDSAASALRHIIEELSDKVKSHVNATLDDNIFYREIRTMFNNFRFALIERAPKFIVNNQLLAWSSGQFRLDDEGYIRDTIELEWKGVNPDSPPANGLPIQSTPKEIGGVEWQLLFFPAGPSPTRVLPGLFLMPTALPKCVTEVKLKDFEITVFGMNDPSYPSHVKVCCNNTKGCKERQLDGSILMSVKKSEGVFDVMSEADVTTAKKFVCRIAIKGFNADPATEDPSTRPYQLTDVKKIIDGTRGRSLTMPGVDSEKAVLRITRDAMQQWEPVCIKCVDEMAESLVSLLTDPGTDQGTGTVGRGGVGTSKSMGVISSVAGPYHELQRTLVQYTKGLITDLVDTAKERIKESLFIEQQPFLGYEPNFEETRREYERLVRSCYEDNNLYRPAAVVSAPAATDIGGSGVGLGQSVATGSKLKTTSAIQQAVETSNVPHGRKFLDRFQPSQPATNTGATFQPSHQGAGKQPNMRVISLHRDQAQETSHLVVAGSLAWFSERCGMLPMHLFRTIVHLVLDEFARIVSRELVRRTNVDSETDTVLFQYFRADEQIEKYRQELVAAKKRQTDGKDLIDDYLKGVGHK